MAPDRQLTEIAARMSSVVDPNLRARLTQRYLGLLQKWHRFPRRGKTINITDRRFVNDVANLERAVRGGQVAYRLSPALGTINDRFNRAYIDATNSLRRLEELVEIQKDYGIKARWKEELADLKKTVDQRRTQAEASSTNANLAYLDAMTTQLHQFIASKLMGREIEWRKQLKMRAQKYTSRGESGVVARQARPDLWYVGRGRKLAYGREKGKGVAANYVTRPADVRSGLSGDLLDTISSFATGIWGGIDQNVQKSADAKYAEFEKCVLRAAEARKRHQLQQEEIAKIRLTDPTRGADLQQDLDGRKQQLVNIETQLRNIATSLKSLTFDEWDAPGSLVQQHLGELSTGEKAAVMLYADGIDAVKVELDTLESADARFGRTSGITVAAAAGGGLALAAAAAAGIWFLARRRR